MNTQSEYALEAALIEQLNDMEYAVVDIDDEISMLSNLKRQIEIHNKDISLTDSEFTRVLNHLNSGGVFERAKTLRDKYALKRDDGDTTYLSFLNCDDWCMNEFQVTHQITMQGKRQNRYDVTILINGLPLVQIELKRRGTELKVAFNQINRYQHHSYDAGFGLFQYVQLFIISNGTNTKYFSNNKVSNNNLQSFKQTFFWTDKENKRFSDLSEFSAEFLKPCHIAKMITHYMVLTEEKIIKVLRPYQFYATEALVEQVKSSNDNAYIWHTTGSGKTLTSFKAAQIIQRMPKVHKVVFVVDRKDLDYQTALEFNGFAKGSVDATTDTRNLVKQLNDDSIKLVLTTIQKLNNAIIKEHYLNKVTHLQDKKFVFIFDECHRSQFGETHQNIKQFFKNAQMFGFTGTPIFADNAANTIGQQKTTKDLFGECLHKYVIVDAIKDENVLRFAVEYVGKYTRKDSANELDIATDIDVQVEAIDTKELLDNPLRLEKITDYILAYHAQKTKSPEFTAMFCVSSVKNLIKYYDLFKQKQTGFAKPLRIATIFSYTQNEEDPNANGLVNGLIPEENLMPEGKVNQNSRDKLDEFIGDYNTLFGTQYSTSDNQSYYNYYQDIAKRVRSGQIDILLVVNMFLTGFDSPRLNTLYVDKNLKHHSLVQAFSRTNRILNEKKSQGNIICFRNLKAATDEAIALFSNKDAKETIETVLLEPYEDYVQQFNEATEALLVIAPTVASVDALPDENAELAFVIKFRELLRIKNILTTFSDFDETDLGLDLQNFDNYKSKYLDLHDKVKKSGEGEKASILEEVDFELTLVHRDEINVAYILNLLASLNKLGSEEAKKRQKEIIDLIAGQVQLRSKRKLIEQFIEENLPKLKPNSNVITEFEKYWVEHQKIAFEQLCVDENVVPDKFEKLLQNYVFANRLPRDQEIIETLSFKPKILERESILTRVSEKIKNFISTFIEGMGGIV
jgi:type I restriction enzyme R subunit